MAAAVRDDVIHVAVGNVVKESELTLRWALHNSGGRRICIIHVHQPAQNIPILGTKFRITRLAEHRVKAYHDAEKRNMEKVLEKYMLICERSGVHAEKLVIEMDPIEKGIIDLIRHHGIGKLVMGGGANRSYSKRMIEPKSKKANYVRQHAPAFCHIWFICKGHLIYTREGRFDAFNLEGSSQSQALTPSTSTGHFSPSISVSGTGQNDLLVHATPANSKVGSNDYRLTQCSGSITDGSIERRGGISRRTSLMIDNSALISTLKTEGSESVFQYSHYDPLPLQSISESSVYDKHEELVEDAETSKKEAYEESIKRKKAEREAIDAICRAKTSESMYAEELRKRREREESLAQMNEEFRGMQQHLNEVMEDLGIAQEQKASLECRIADSNLMVEELERKILSSVDLMQKFKNERDELEVKLENAQRIAEEVRDKQAGLGSEECFQTPSHFVSPIFQNTIDGSRISRVPFELSDSSLVDNIKEQAYDIAHMVKYVMKSTGKAIWIAATSFIIVGLPLIIVRNQEQASIDLNSQQERLILPFGN